MATIEIDNDKLVEKLEAARDSGHYMIAIWYVGKSEKEDQAPPRIHYRTTEKFPIGEYFGTDDRPGVVPQLADELKKEMEAIEANRGKMKVVTNVHPAPINEAVQAAGIEIPDPFKSMPEAIQKKLLAMTDEQRADLPERVRAIIPTETPDASQDAPEQPATTEPQDDQVAHENDAGEPEIDMVGPDEEVVDENEGEIIMRAPDEVTGEIPIMSVPANQDAVIRDDSDINDIVPDWVDVVDNSVTKYGDAVEKMLDDASDEAAQPIDKPIDDKAPLFAGMTDGDINATPEEQPATEPVDGDGSKLGD